MAGRLPLGLCRTFVSRGLEGLYRTFARDSIVALRANKVYEARGT